MKKKSREFKDLVRGRQGQAIVEYILILVVSLALILTVTVQVFKPMQFFLKDFMGTYVQCLLDTGELPALGGSNKIKDDECKASWSKSRQASGLSPQSSGEGAGSSDKKSSSGDASSSDGSNSGFYAGSRSRQSPFFNSSRRGASSAESSANSKKSVIIALGEGSDSDKFFRAQGGNRGGYSSSKPNTIVDLSSMSDEERKKIGKNEPKVPRIVASGENFSKLKKKVVANPPPAKVFVEKEEDPFQFGNIFRILFILAIILVLVLLIGGQALQLSKSWEK
ncbi:MAG: hypothetical protein AABY64_09980 [Bdellovibrionota bacterium]